jgi:hypothetical protein
MERIQFTEWLSDAARAVGQDVGALDAAARKLSHELSDASE